MTLRRPAACCCPPAAPSRLPRAWRQAIGVVAVLSAGTVGAAPGDVDLQAAAADPDGWTVRLTDQPVARTLDAAPGSYGFATATRSMAWVSRGRVELGLGVDRAWAAPAPAQPPQEPSAVRHDSLVLGVSLRTGAAQRLMWQTDADPAAPRMSLQVARPYRALARGALRMELSRDTALSFKPRARSVGVTLTSRW